MYQVPQDLWKEIDRQIGLKSEMAKKLVQTNDLDEAMEEVYFELKESFEHNSLSASFSFGLLYIENRTISRYIEKTNEYELRNTLPEILSQEEIWEYVRRDRMLELNQLEKQQLELLLYRALGSIEDKI